MADLLHAITMALVGEEKLEVLRHAIPAFSTVSEIYVVLLEAWETRKSEEWK